MDHSTNCNVCQKHQTLKTLPGGIIFQNNSLFIAHFPLIESQLKPYYGHIIIEFKRHITRPSELTNIEAQDLGLWIQKISTALESSLGAEHTYIFRIGDKTPHLHFHLVPRYANTPIDAWGTSLYEWPQARRADAREIIDVSNKLRMHLERTA